MLKKVNLIHKKKYTDVCYLVNKPCAFVIFKYSHIKYQILGLLILRFLQLILLPQSLPSYKTSGI